MTPQSSKAHLLQTPHDETPSRCLRHFARSKTRTENWLPRHPRKKNLPWWLKHRNWQKRSSWQTERSRMRTRCSSQSPAQSETSSSTVCRQVAKKTLSHFAKWARSRRSTLNPATILSSARCWQRLTLPAGSRFRVLASTSSVESARDSRLPSCPSRSIKLSLRASPRSSHQRSSVPQSCRALGSSERTRTRFTTYRPTTSI